MAYQQQGKNAHTEQKHLHSQGDVVAADGHKHADGQEENYDEIVGSLGSVNDEGCEDLSGVRIIVTDEAYNPASSTHDYSAIAQAMVLGEILGTPRCKKPYGKR